jgi:hypothetical protein
MKANRHYATSNQLAFQGGAYGHCHRASPEMTRAKQEGRRLLGQKKKEVTWLLGRRRRRRWLLG